ncbi:hypothetical protein BDW42DRAFT_106992 [Aspergillus taichungensis]|uniref:Uncharacterized protein n=1 Tax=Aspergillus taichungensis TaxID=482145 RepID=A0A2J5HTP2_9EURO|nr:hypothetical protein BDW42DRAFT_106992 [Aspergillus taichungensis]
MDRYADEFVSGVRWLYRGFTKSSLISFFHFIFICLFLLFVPFFNPFSFVALLLIYDRRLAFRIRGAFLACLLHVCLHCNSFYINNVSWH